MAGIPQGFHTITPQIHVTNGDKAIALYKKALGAKELHRILAPGSEDDQRVRVLRSAARSCSSATTPGNHSLR